MKYLVVLLVFVWAAALANGAYSSSVSGQLTFEDRKLDGCPIDWLPIPAVAGQNLSIKLHSNDFDSYLYLSRYSSVDAPYLIGSNDDGLGGLDAYLEHRVTSDGVLYAGVSSLGCATGSYSLEVSTVSPSPNLTGNLSANASEVTLEGRYLNWHQVYLERGEVNIYLRSSDFDSFVYLARDNGAGVSADDVLATNDDCGDSYGDACITWYLEQSDYYLIGASSYGARETGSYALEFRTARADNPFQPINIQGSLSRSDERYYYDGSAIDWIPFEVPSGGAHVVIDLQSDELDTYLMLAHERFSDERQQGSYLIASDDDSGGNLNSRLERDLEAGRYYVAVNSALLDKYGD
jgi:hypothetical protein